MSSDIQDGSDKRTDAPRDHENAWEDLDRYVSCMGLVRDADVPRSREVEVPRHRLRRRNDGMSPILKLSMISLILEAKEGVEYPWHRVAELTEGAGNATLPEAALLLFRGMALRRMGLFSAARDALDHGLERCEILPEELVDSLLTERAMTDAALVAATRSAKGICNQ
jgi:hypothetical protein